MSSAIPEPAVPLAILGGGVTGLAAGRASGGVVFEAGDGPGGICSSYYVRPGSQERLAARPEDGGAYRFEVGGGHWIFGGEPAVLELIDGWSPLVVHERRAGVHFASVGRSTAYPFQDHVAALDPALALRAAQEQAAGTPAVEGIATMAGWLHQRFGPALCERFFDPFHERYTAGHYHELAPQDAYKSPQGQAGYNVTFRYPPAGLDVVTRAMADGVDVRYRHRVTGIEAATRTVSFADGRAVAYDRLVCTLPLDVTLALCGVGADQLGPADLATGVVVVNIGGRRGPGCPDEHWLYDPEARAGFHRYGIYSNVDPSFVPHGDPNRVAIYVEHATPGRERPSAEAEGALVAATVAELVERGVVADVEVVDVSWVPTAYTWARPGSTWVDDALALLSAQGVEQVGRYARWHFQGIAESIADGLAIGPARR